ncbi:MAG TPA: UvrD-helicase domain-containing protein [Fimbriimonadaceae bacterium]|nr:UvrD-helicase domain-containing protein [Fimbriimonadaceae bacterium]
MSTTSDPPAFEPTPEQLEVIQALDSAMIVTASAGAGKTAVLVQRYLKYVEDGLEPDQILTITFTKKAAAEMKRRIVAHLRKKRLMRQAQVAETGPIQTIHSFCERLLRENALEAGLDPKFEIVGEGESGEMAERAVRDTLSSALEERPEAERLIAYLAGQRSFGAGQSPYAKLESSVQSVLDRLRGSGLEYDELERRYCDPASLQDLIESRIAEHLPLPVSNYLANHRGGAFADRLQAAYKDWGERAPRWIAAKPDEPADREALDHTAGLFQICASAWLRMEHEIDREQRLDFTALESRALRLLQRSATTRLRVRKQYKVVMVDEAQDVNPLQHHLLEAMEIESEMLVGDAQQSIYGFRLADPALFKDRIGEDSKRLSVNMRSRPGILRFVDLVFGSLWHDYAPMTPPPSPIDLDVIELPVYSGVELWRQADKSTFEIAQLVREMLGEHEISLGDVAILVRDSAFAQEMKSSLDRLEIPCRITGGTERFYARLEIRDLANTLRALGDPYDDFALLAMLRSPVVGLSLDAIAVLSQARPVVDSLGEFVSPVEEDADKLSCFLEWFTPLRGFADRLSAWEVLSELFAVSGYLPSLALRRNAPQLLANVRKLLRLAAEEPELGPLEYAERIREIQRLKHREGDAPAEDEKADLITIMTIHKAKGLEWPVVIVPEMHKAMGRRSKDVEIDPRLHLAVTKFGKRPSIYYTWLADLRHARETEEELRLLYVAFTRARERLCVVVHGSARPDTPAKRIAGIIGLGKTAPAGFEYRDPPE